jgi:hypothetical protein
LEHARKNHYALRQYRTAGRDSSMLLDDPKFGAARREDKTTLQHRERSGHGK